MNRLDRLNYLLRDPKLNLPDIRKAVNRSGGNLAWLKKNMARNISASQELIDLLNLDVHHLMQELGPEVVNKGFPEPRPNLSEFEVVCHKTDNPAVIGKDMHIDATVVITADDITGRKDYIQRMAALGARQLGKIIKEEKGFIERISTPKENAGRSGTPHRKGANPYFRRNNSDRSKG